MSGTPRHPPIAIAGMHRSGTSMVTRALHDAGLHLIGGSAETLISAAEDNPEGFWENKAIVACNDDLLEATGGSWDRPPEFPPQGADDPRVAHVVDAAVAALAALGEHEHWGFKDPRLCLTAPFWLDLQPDLRFVICLRHPLEVALSLKRRNQNSYSLGLALWERYYTAILAAVPPERRLVSHYDSFFFDPEGELGRVCGFADLTPAAASVRGDLRHHTIEVSLTDAGVSAHVRSLYASLCREARVSLPPDSPADEGRVRRLILDGAVAARYAEQRLAALERLEERAAANEESLRARIRDLEHQLAATRAVLQRELLPGPTAKRLVRGSARVSVRTVRRLGNRGSQSAAPLGRRVQRRISATAHPYPSVNRVLGSAADRAPAGNGARPEVASAPAPVTNSRVQSVLRHLPPDIERPLTGTWLRLRRAQAAPIVSARRAIETLPAPAQAAARRAWRSSSHLRRRTKILVRRIQPDGGARRPVPKGPAFRGWRAGYEELVRAIVPIGSASIVVAPGSPSEVRDAMSPRATRFPDTPRARPLADDLAHIAHLEALRSAGNRFLIVPEGSRPWFRQQHELRHHILGAYRCLADRPGAGIAFALDDAPAVSDGTLYHAIERLARATDHSPAVLQWSALNVAGELVGVTAFRPPAGTQLPYVDDSIEIVVRDEQQDHAEARRVATLGVITIAKGVGGIDVLNVDPLRAPAPAEPIRTLVRAVTVSADEGWAGVLAASVADAGAHLELGTGPDAWSADTADYDVVIMLEPFILPLPGAISSAADLAHSQPDTAVTGKVVRADGRIDSAGGFVFSDRSVALVAEGGQDTRAPWHDYRRPVCFAAGFVAASTLLVTTSDAPPRTPMRTYLREFCATVWEQGGSVIYEPTIAAVRVSGRGGEASVPLQESRWQRVLDLRPRRPEQLGDDEWRRLVACDDVEACRG